MASGRYLTLLRDAADLHVRKSAGYAGRDNPDTWANFREAERWGITPLQGCLVRMGDKFVRAQNLTRDATNDQVGESLRETLVDLLAYAGISVCLLDEQRLGPESPVWPGETFVIGSRDYTDRLAQVRHLRERFGESGAAATLGPDTAGLLQAIDELLEATVV